jgi:Ca2+-binding EF-hand superfamily protein
MPEKNDALANAIASLPEHLRAQTISKMDKRAPLLTEEGDLTDKFAKVLTELFHSFDSDGDGLLSKKELDEYARSCNDGTPFSEEEHGEIQLFLQCEKDAEGKFKGLTERGFHDLYHTQTSSREEDTYEDLRKLGYDLTDLSRRTSSDDKATDAENDKKAEGKFKAQSEKIAKWRAAKRAEWDVEGSKVRQKNPTIEMFEAWLDRQCAKAKLKAARASGARH